MPKGSIVLGNLQYVMFKPSHLVNNCLTLLQLHRAISEDPERYLNPEEFIPDRFLPENANPKCLDPRTYAFGMGRRYDQSYFTSRWINPDTVLVRRVCPGRHLAEMSLYTFITTMLATSTISKALDENGNASKITFEGNAMR